MADTHVSSSEQIFVRDEIGQYAPHSELRPSATQENLDFAGRFRVPRSLSDRLIARIKSRVSGLHFDIPLAANASEEIAPMIPTPWRALLAYLLGENIMQGTAHISSIFHDEPKAFHITIPFSVDAATTDGRPLDRGGYSCHADFETALSKATGELLERRMLSTYRQSNLRVSTTQDLIRAKELCLDPALLAGFSEEQRMEHAGWGYDAKKSLHWATGIRLRDQAAAFIPAQLVFWNYQILEKDPEPFLREANTNGCGGGFTREGALLSALLESIQRDAFLVHWLNGIAPRRVSLKSIVSEQLRALLATLARYRMEVVLLDTTLDMPVPSCIAVLIDRSGVGLEVTIGGGSGYNLEAEFRASIFEAMSGRWKLRAMRNVGTLDPRDERLYAWGAPGSIEKIKPFLNGEEISFKEINTPSFSTEKEALGSVVTALVAKGNEYEPYAYEVSHPVLNAIGYHDARVVVPALVPLYLSLRYPSLGAKRLYEVPKAMHLKGGMLEEHISHPFP